MTRIPTLPPPYTATSTRAGSLRTNADSFTAVSEILVGPKPARFLLHTSLLTEQSSYFRAALKGAFAESTEQSICLEDVSVESFECLVTWLYTGSIKPAPFKDGKPAYYKLLHLYILADRFCFEGLRNHIVDLMADLADTTNSVLTPSDTRILYNEINEGARIRQLVLDLFAFKKTDKLIATHGDPWHPGFLRDLCVRLKKPCRQAMQRHRLRTFMPMTWNEARACDNCRNILPPRIGAVGCDECCCAWCIRCYEDGVGIASWEDGRGAVLGNESEEGKGGGRKRKVCYGRRWESCKPWRGSRCMVYHEHSETDHCSDVFMGK